MTTIVVRCSGLLEAGSMVLTQFSADRRPGVMNTAPCYPGCHDAFVLAPPISDGVIAQSDFQQVSAREEGIGGGQGLSAGQPQGMATGVGACDCCGVFGECGGIVLA